MGQRWPYVTNFAMNITANHMAAIFSIGTNVCLHDSASWHTAKITQVWFGERDKQFKVLTWVSNSVGFSGKTSLSHGSRLSGVFMMEVLTTSSHWKLILCTVWKAKQLVQEKFDHSVLSWYWWKILNITPKANRCDTSWLQQWENWRERREVTH